MVNSDMEADLAMDKLENPLTHLPGYALRRAAAASMANLAERFAAIELRISDASVLQLIGSSTVMTSAEIGKVLDIRSANMVPVLSRLEKAELIKRPAIDRKSQAIVLTAAGMRRLDEIHAITDAFETELLQRIPEVHRDHFLPALKVLCDWGAIG
jgi:DNA-binding MarR family transcriptional regulator